jgi:hypothetical protein
MFALGRFPESYPVQTMILLCANYVVPAYLVEQSPIADREQLSCSFAIPVGVLERTEDCLGLGLGNAAAEGSNLPNQGVFRSSR